MRRTVPVAALGSAMGVLLVASVPGHDGRVAAISQPSGVGHLRCWYVLHRFATILVPGVGAGPRNSAGSRTKNLAKEILRCARARLAQFSGTLATASNRVFATGRARHAAGVVSAQRCEFGFRGRAVAGLAFDNLPALLRCGRGLFRVRDGTEHRDSGSQNVSAGGPDYASASQQHGERD